MEEAAVPSALEGDPDCARHQTVLQSLISESAQPTTSKGVPEQTPGVSADGSDSTKGSTLRALTSGSAQAATSKVVGESASAQEENPSPRPRYYIGLSGPLFHGVLETSQKGVHPVIRYSIPGGEYCYAFAYVRTVKRTQVVVYRCIACKRKGVTNSIAVQNESEFIGDPAELPHVCTPLLNAKDRVQRMMYQSCRAIAVDPTLAEAKPSQLWKSIAELIDKNAPEDEALRNEMLKQFYRNGYKSRSRTIARAAARLRRAAAGNATSEQGGEAPKPKTEEMS